MQTLATQPLVKIRAIDKIGDDVESVIFTTYLMHAGDTRVVQLSRGPSIAQKKLSFFFTKVSLPGDFDGHRALKLRITGFPYAAKATRANLMDQLETAEHLDAAGIRARASRA